MEDIEEESPKKESILGIVLLMLINLVFGEILSPMGENSSLALHERYEKKTKTIIIVIFKMLHQQLQIYP